MLYYVVAAASGLVIKVHSRLIMSNQKTSSIQILHMVDCVPIFVTTLHANIFINLYTNIHVKLFYC